MLVFYRKHRRCNTPFRISTFFEVRTKIEGFITTHRVFTSEEEEFTQGNITRTRCLPNGNKCSEVPAILHYPPSPEVGIEGIRITELKEGVFASQSGKFSFKH